MIYLLIVKILGFLFVLAGAILVYGSKPIASHFRLAEKVNCNFEDQLTEEELSKYKVDKAVLNIKLKGAAILLPGLIALVLSFK